MKRWLHHLFTFEFDLAWSVFVILILIIIIIIIIIILIIIMMITSSSHIFEFDLARLVATSAFLTAPQPLQIPSSARKSNSNTNTDTKQIQTMNLKKREKSFGFHKNKQRATHPLRSGCPLAKSGAEPGRLTVLIQILHSCRNFLSMFSFCRLNLFLLWSWQRIVLPYRSVCEG